MTKDPEFISPRRIRVSICNAPPMVIDQGEDIIAVSLWRALRPVLTVWLILGAATFVAGVFQ